MAFLALMGADQGADHSLLRDSLFVSLNVLVETLMVDYCISSSILLLLLQPFKSFFHGFSALIGKCVSLVQLICILLYMTIFFLNHS